MKLRPLLLLSTLVLLGWFELPARCAAQAESNESSNDEATQEVRRRQRVIEELALNAAGEAQSPEDLVEHLLELRREIDELLARLQTESPAIELGSMEHPSDLVGTQGSDEAASVLAVEPPLAVVPPAESPSAISVPADPACAEFRLFDTNGDGVVSGLDRYWRYLKLWRDDGDGEIEARELGGLYDGGVGEITAALGTYRTVDGLAGDVWADGAIRLDLPGKKGSMTILAIDADRLARGGELELQDRSGVVLHGLQALTSKMVVVSAAGDSAPLACD